MLINLPTGMGKIFRDTLLLFVVITALIGTTSSALAQEQKAPPNMECGTYEQIKTDLVKQGAKLASSGIADATGTPLKNVLIEVWANTKGSWMELVIMVAPGTTTKIACVVAEGTNWFNYFSPGELAND